MRKLLLTAAAIATLSLNAYSQYGHGHVDFSSLPIKVEAGMMIPHNNTYTISSDFYGASFDTESGYFDTKIKDILDNPKPIAYLGIGADLPGKNRFITNGIMLRVGYENYEYTVLGEKHPFALHLQAAGKALKYASENAEDLAAELIGIPESPQCITARSRCCHHDRHDPPYIEIKP